MRIENLRREVLGKRARVAATVIWEDCDRSQQELYFETEEEFAEGLVCNPHAFLIGAIVPAFHYGEQRISLAAEICPELRSGLIAAMKMLSIWFPGSGRDIVRIEAAPRSYLPTPRTPDRAGFFYSGGVDSLATLRSNRLDFPREHPLAIRDGLLVYGLEIEEPDAFEHVKQSLFTLAHEADITLVPVYTNLYLTYRQEDKAQDFCFWTDKFQGAAFSAIAHAFSARLSVVTIAGSSEIRYLTPSGTHPILDPNYSSAEIRIKHDGVTLSRLEKTRLLAEWEVALHYLRVCNLSHSYRSDMLNCGQCPKCVKTMLALLALGVLEKSTAFPKQQISADLVMRKALIYDAYSESNYRELIPLLAEQGRDDLVQAIRHLIAKYHEESPAWKVNVRQFDQRYLNGRLRRLLAFMRAE